MTDERILEVYNELRQPNWLPASFLGSTRPDIQKLFDAYPDQEEEAFRSALSYVATNEWWRSQDRVSLKLITNNNKMVRYVEMYGLGGGHTYTPEGLVASLSKAKTPKEVDDILMAVRPDPTQPIFFDDVPYALRWYFDEVFIMQNPGRWRILGVGLIKEGDGVVHQGNLYTVQRVVRYDLIGIQVDDTVLLVSPQIVEVL